MIRLAPSRKAALSRLPRARNREQSKPPSRRRPKQAPSRNRRQKRRLSPWRRQRRSPPLPRRGQSPSGRERAISSRPGQPQRRRCSSAGSGRPKSWRPSPAGRGSLENDGEETRKRAGRDGATGAKSESVAQRALRTRGGGLGQRASARRAG